MIPSLWRGRFLPGVIQIRRSILNYGPEVTSGEAEVHADCVKLPWEISAS